MAAQFKDKPDYVTTPQCNRLHDMLEKRFDKVENNQEKQAEKLNEVLSVLKDGIKKEVEANSIRIVVMIKTHKWMLRSFIGLLIAIIINMVILLLR